MAEGDDEAILRCAFCEGAARVIPGPIFSDADWLAFAELDSAVFAADLDGARSAALAEEVQDLLRDVSADDAAKRLLQQLPSLTSVRPALLYRWPRGARMLVTLLLARSREPSPRSSREFNERDLT